VPKVTFITPGFDRITVEAAEGVSLMRAAVDNQVPGIEADCGGACACATCHVYVAEEWVSQLPPPGTVEVDMVEFAVEPNETSRLACQVVLTAKLDGLTVSIPKAQV
jgi:2Fe-2S ferredoxin